MLISAGKGQDFKSLPERYPRFILSVHFFERSKKRTKIFFHILFFVLTQRKESKERSRLQILSGQVPKQRISPHVKLIPLRGIQTNMLSSSQRNIRCLTLYSGKSLMSDTTSKSHLFQTCLLLYNVT